MGEYIGQSQSHGIGKGFFRQQDRACPLAKFIAQVRQITAHTAIDRSTVQDALAQGCIPPGRGQDEQTELFDGRVRERHDCAFFKSGSSTPSYFGMPVRTPRNSRRGSPTRMRPDSRRNSRMVCSWLPPRFLMIEIAWRTSPKASK